METQAMAVRKENWLRTIQAATQSGKTQEAWYREQGIASSTFYRWKQTLRNRLLSTQQAEAPASCFAELALSENIAERNHFHRNTSFLCAQGSTPLNCRQIAAKNSGAESFGRWGMLAAISRVEHIYLACGYTDLRREIDGLAQLVERQFHLNPCTNNLFLFCGRRRERIKAMPWEGDGFVLLYSVWRTAVVSNGRAANRKCVS